MTHANDFPGPAFNPFSAAGRAYFEDVKRRQADYAEDDRIEAERQERKTEILRGIGAAIVISLLLAATFVSLQASHDRHEQMRIERAV